MARGTLCEALRAHLRHKHPLLYNCDKQVDRIVESQHLSGRVMSRMTDDVEWQAKARSLSHVNITLLSQA